MIYTAYVCAKTTVFSVKNTLKIVITVVNLLSFLIINLSLLFLIINLSLLFNIIIYRFWGGEVIESVGHGLWGSKFLPPICHSRTF
jgi:hypothetical protein